MISIIRRLAPAMVACAFLVAASEASANTYVVNRSDDPDNGTGFCSTGGSCSLREAVNAANANAGADTVTFSVTTAHITNLGNTNPFGVHSTGPITIDGGATVTILGDSGANMLVLDNSAVSTVAETVKNLTIDGQGTFHTGNGGGGVFVESSGGGASETDATLDHVTVERITDTSSGAGVESVGANQHVTIVDSTIQNNTANGGSLGGAGVYVGDGTLNVTRSTFSGNATDNVGGAIRLAFGAQAPTGTIVDSTFNQNSANDGGAISDGGGQLKVSYSTIAGNTTTGGVSASAILTNGFTTDRLKANILNDPGASKECSNVGGTVDGFNFIRDASCTSSTANSNHPSTSVSVGALANNGGPTQTQALSSGSPAIDSGQTTTCTDISGATVSVDQRGNARPQGSACDAGAFEFVPAPANSVLPSISGTPAVGQTLTCNPGTWSGSPTFTYQWLNDGTAITGATSNTYNVASTDAGHTLACRVTATNSGGSNQATGAGVSISAGGSGGGGSGGGGSGGGGGTTVPTVTAFNLSASAFPAAPSGPTAVAARKFGTIVSFKLSTAATVRFTVKHKVPGHKKGKRCVAKGKGKRCQRTVTVGSFTVKGTAGNNRFRFTGRLNGHKLPRGNYILVLVASDSAGKSKPKTHPFRIIK